MMSTFLRSSFGNLFKSKFLQVVPIRCERMRVIAGTGCVRKHLSVSVHVGQIAARELVLHLTLLKLLLQAAHELALLFLAAEHGWHLLSQRPSKDHVRARRAHAAGRESTRVSINDVRWCVLLMRVPFDELVDLAVAGARGDLVQVAEQVRLLPLKQQRAQRVLAHVRPRLRTEKVSP